MLALPCLVMWQLLLFKLTGLEKDVEDAAEEKVRRREWWTGVSLTIEVL